MAAALIQSAVRITSPLGAVIRTADREPGRRAARHRPAVWRGTGQGRLVTSAALILFLAMAALASAPLTFLKIFATGVGAGILLDATVVRSLLVPGAGIAVRRLELVAAPLGRQDPAGGAVAPGGGAIAAASRTARAD